MMTPPPSRGEPALNLPPLVQTLCLINIGVFLLLEYVPQLFSDETLLALSFIPARYTGHAPFDVGAVISPITHMFLHAGWLHLGMNVGTLMAFGTGMERALGPKKMLLFYFATGLCGAALHTIFYPDAQVPMIGASGAISGLFGGIVMMMHEAEHGNVRSLGASSTRKLMPVVAVWIGVSVFFGFFGAPGVDNPVAWTTHIGGFIAGLALYRPIRRLNIRG